MALTTGERSALRWLTAVAALGAGANIHRHWRYSDAVSPQAGEALSRQLLAVDSAQRSGRQGRRGPVAGNRQPGGRRPQVRPPRTVVDAETVSPRRQSDARRAVRNRNSAPDQPTLGPVDLDRADSATLERLPRIGPSLAARIVADRSANGPYGSLDGLQRVRGIGPKLAKGLEALVTFSGTPRPSLVRH